MVTGLRDMPMTYAFWSEANAPGNKASVTCYLTGELKLAVNEQKSRVVKTTDCEFLGFTFRGTKLRWSDQAFADFKHHVPGD